MGVVLRHDTFIKKLKSTKMAHYFTASRIAGKKNVVFPDEIVIKSDVVIYRKGRVIGYKETKIDRDSIGSVSIDAHLLFADVIIETRGGMKVRAEGFTRGDASDIADLLS